jgi:hypothetical protein
MKHYKKCMITCILKMKWFILKLRLIQKCIRKFLNKNRRDKEYVQKIILIQNQIRT